ncbi:MAG TPA: hypothetical protein VK993_12910 [Chthoniobacterales bacterium]|nr:hypothetical protein [Chthoniobacterales bacterium]
MRSLLVIALACCLGHAALRAQDVALPRPETQDPAPEGTRAPTPPSGDLIPADILPPPDPAALPGTLDIPSIEQLDEGLKPPPLSPAAEAYRRHIEWRKLRNKVQNDARVKAAEADADAAKTDLQRRKLLARYFEIYYGRMMAMASPEMKPYLLDRKREYLAALPQPRVRPETAPKPAPTPPGSVAASPSPTATVPASGYGSPSPSPSARSGLFGLPRP